MVRRIKLAFIFGTRPEAIKLAPVILEAKKMVGLEISVCVTGQHRQMLDAVLDFFGIVPDVDFQVMRPDQSLTGLTALVLEKVSAYLLEARPDCVIVQGDTTTVLASALAAFYNKIKIGHVEAGLRTGNMGSPFPEEMNRVMVSRIADFHFAPTETARENLLAEKPFGKIMVTGNTVIDALLAAVAKISVAPPEIPTVPFNSFDEADRIVLITGHRRENFGEGFASICRAIRQLAIANPLVRFIYPVHLNPNVQKPAMEYLGDQPNIYLIGPQDYKQFVYLMTRSYLILTDSGGVQEEAPALGKPVLVMRTNTERPEGVAAGGVRLVGADAQSIVTQTQLLLDDPEVYASMARARNPYGDGTASKQILSFIMTLTVADTDNR